MLGGAAESGLTAGRSQSIFMNDYSRLRTLRTEGGNFIEWLHILVSV